MAVCKQCGKNYTGLFARGPGTGLCDKCWEAAEAEARKKQGEEAKASLPTLFAAHVPGENAAVLGAAYWNTPGTAAGTLVAKLVFGGLFGGPGALAEEHRAGIVAVTDTHLFLVDLGKVVTKELTLKVMRGALGPPSVKKAQLRNLTAECDSQAGVLNLTGELKVRATFPRVFEEGNPAKAAMIARAVQSRW